MPDARLECDLPTVEGCRNGDGGHLIGKRGDWPAFIRRGAIVPVALDAGPSELDAGPSAVGVRFKPVVSDPFVRSLDNGSGDAVETDRNYLRGIAEGGRGGRPESILNHKAAGWRGRCHEDADMLLIWGEVYWQVNGVVGSLARARVDTSEYTEHQEYQACSRAGHEANWPRAAVRAVLEERPLDNRCRA